jgi:hypothetical protein
LFFSMLKVGRSYAQYVPSKYAPGIALPARASLAGLVPADADSALLQMNSFSGCLPYF